MMNWSLAILLIAVVLLLTVKREPFTEMFGFSGHSRPTGRVRFDDSKPDLTSYRQAEADINNDMMQEFVLQTNKEISKRTGLCTYIIETIAVNKYVAPTTNAEGVPISSGKNDVYEAIFMTVKNNGFAFGFTVIAYFEVTNSDAITLKSLRTQPLDVESESDISPFKGDPSGKEFVNYELVKEKAVPTLGELEMAKNKLQ
jgi:hypothetical protein